MSWAPPARDFRAVDAMPRIRLSYAPASGAVEPSATRSAPASRAVAPRQVPVDAKVELESDKPLRHLAEPNMEEDTPPRDSRRSVLARRCKAARTEAVRRLASKQRVVVCPGRAKIVRFRPSSEDGLPSGDSGRSVRARRIKAARAEAVGRLAPKQRVAVRPGQRRSSSPDEPP